MSRSSLQQGRSAETRKRLLEAAIACLYEKGYAGTTTSEIAGRAGVSRGAQVHHFPHKEELVLGALECVHERRLDEFERTLEQLPAGTFECRLDMLIDLTWARFKGPSFYAWLELLVASRTDPAMRDAVLAVSRRLGGRLQKTLTQFLCAQAANTSAEIAARIEQVAEIVLGRLESLALERALSAAQSDDPQEAALSIRSLKQVAREMLGFTRASQTGSRGEFDESS